MKVKLSILVVVPAASAPVNLFCARRFNLPYFIRALLKLRMVHYHIDINGACAWFIFFARGTIIYVVKRRGAFNSQTCS